MAVVKTIFNLFNKNGKYKNCIDLAIIGRVDRAFASETLDSGSIPGRVNLKTITVDIHCFPA